jgi:hypothetical protein
VIGHRRRSDGAEIDRVELLRIERIEQHAAIVPAIGRFPEDR